MPKGVKKTMLPTLEQRIAAELSPDSELCPLCCADWVIEGTKGYDYGVCPHCYTKAKNAALDAYAADGRLRMDYNMARKRKERAVNKGDVPYVSSRKIEPDFDLLRRL